MICVALCRLDNPPPAIMAVPLSLEEEDSAKSAGTEKRRREINVSRRLLRYCLHTYMELPINTELYWGDKGPRSIDQSESINLSVAHSRSHAATTLSTQGSIGVDVESTAFPPTWQKIMAGFFCQQDIDWITRINTLNRTDGLHRFLAIWTAREAYAKFCHGSVLYQLSQVVLREWVVNGMDSHVPNENLARVDVSLGDSWIVAVCREPHKTTSPVMMVDFQDDTEIEPYRPAFTFLVEGDE